MTDFEGQDLSGARFEDVRLAGARFRNVDLQGARFNNIDLRNAVIRGVFAVSVELDGEIQSLEVNGVDVAPFVEAELDRRYPERAKMRATNIEEFREAWTVLERLWDQTVERARRFPPELLNERVDEEWSFIETLRHLVFATDKWIALKVLGEPSPWHPLGLPHDEMPEDPSIQIDRDARPDLQEVLALRADRQGTVRRLVDELTDEGLERMTEPVKDPDDDAPRSFPVRECLWVILSEEWEHRLFAERDLDVLEARST